MLRVTLLAMALPVALSLAGPIYYGYENGPYWRILIWAAACTCILMWTTRRSLVGAFRNGSQSPAIGLINLIAILAAVGVCFLIGDSIAYFLARSISS